MPLAFQSLPILLSALALALAAALVASLRRPELPRLSYALIAAGLLLLALAAGGTTWRHAQRGEVLVMVDVSPSTRTAIYRNRAALDRRISQLLGATPHRTFLFAESIRPDTAADPLPDVAADRTIFAPPPAD